MADDAAALLDTLLASPADFAGGARWTALFAQAARERRQSLLSGLAEGERQDGIHVVPESLPETSAIARPLAAATSTNRTRARYRAEEIEVVLAINPEGGGFALLRGAGTARLEGIAGAEPLQERQWCRVPQDWRSGFPQELRLILADGQVCSLMRVERGDHGT